MTINEWIKNCIINNGYTYERALEILAMYLSRGKVTDKMDDAACNLPEVMRTHQWDNDQWATKRRV